MADVADPLVALLDPTAIERLKDLQSVEHPTPEQLEEARAAAASVVFRAAFQAALTICQQRLNLSPADEIAWSLWVVQRALVVHQALQNGEFQRELERLAAQ